MSPVNRDQVAAIAQSIGSALMPDNDVWTNRFTVESETSSNIYTVAQRRSDGVWGCSCKGWTHYRKCKHVTRVLARLAIFATSPEAKKYDAPVRSVLESARTAFLDIEVKAIRPVMHRPRRVLDL